MKVIISKGLIFMILRVCMKVIISKSLIFMILRVLYAGDFAVREWT